MDTTPNLVAYLALALFTPVALFVAKRHRAPVAATALFVSAILFLPEAELGKLPMIPAWKKANIGAVGTLFALWMYHRDRFRLVFPRRWPRLFFWLALINAVGSTFTNMDPVVWGRMVIPPQEAKDVLGFLQMDLYYLLAPFLIGAVGVHTERELVDMLSVLVALCLVYSIPFVIELRFSPQVNYWIYGFQQHGFAQTIRDGGFRPMVCMAHGLALALFLVLAGLAAATLRKLNLNAFRWNTRWVLPYLLGLLILAKSKGALVFGIATVPLVFLTSARTQLRVSVLMCAIVLAYPWVRMEGMIQREPVYEQMAAVFGEERAQSLDVRLWNEEILLERAKERFYFGWGLFDRASVYDEWSETPLTIRDGAWIIWFGNRGVVGWFVLFGLLCLPVFAAWRAHDSLPTDRTRRLVAGLAVITAVQALDLVPNGMFNALGLFCAGALYAVVPRLSASVPARARPRPA